MFGRRTPKAPRQVGPRPGANGNNCCVRTVPQQAPRPMPRPVQRPVQRPNPFVKR